MNQPQERFGPAPWFIGFAFGGHPENNNSPLSRSNWQHDPRLDPPAPRPPPVDLFARLPDEVIDPIVEDYFAYRYSTSPAANDSNGNAVFDHHDNCFEWLKPEPELHDYEEVDKAIPYYQYEECYNKILETFSCSATLASAGVRVFIRSHTRRLHANHLDPKLYPRVMSIFPLAKLQHITISLDAGDVDNYKATRFHALVNAMPGIPSTMPALKSLKVEMAWIQRIDPANPITTPLEDEYVFRVRKDIRVLSAALSALAEHIPHVALESSEQVIKRDTWDIDHKQPKKAFLLPIARTEKVVSKAEGTGTGTGTGTSVDSVVEDDARRTNVTGENTGDPGMRMGTLPYRGPKGPATSSR